MKDLRVKSIGAGLAWIGLIVAVTCAQVADRWAFLDPASPVEQRAVRLVYRMILKEDPGQLVNQSRTITTWHVLACDWRSAAQHGSACDALSEIPEPIVLGAVFDTGTIQPMNVHISIQDNIRFMLLAVSH